MRPFGRPILAAVCLASGLLTAPAAAAPGAPTPTAASPGARSPAPLRVEVWVEVEPISSAGDPWPVPAAELVLRLRAEAAWVLGGMTRGFSFAYAPSDRARGIEEAFELKSLGGPDPAALAELPPASPARSGTLRAAFELTPDADAAAAMATYSRDPWRPSQGQGAADALGGHPARQDAYEDALRDAVRGLARALEPNKPRSVAGRLVLAAPPTIGVVDGEYRVQARVRIAFDSIEPYRVY